MSKQWVCGLDRQRKTLTFVSKIQKRHMWFAMNVFDLVAVVCSLGSLGHVGQCALHMDAKFGRGLGCVTSAG